MRFAREGIAGVASGLAFLGLSLLLGAQAASADVRAFALLIGLGGAGAVGVFTALAVHLGRGPAGYQPLEGEGSAWGFMEFDEATGRPRTRP